MRVVIAGAGIAGLTAALSLARQGHAVEIIDRDQSDRPSTVNGAAAWRRRGVAQFEQPHAILSRLFSELENELPDILAALRRIGVPEISLPDGLHTIWCRRSTLEWVLAEAVAAEARITTSTGNVLEVETENGRAVGLRLADGSNVGADLVIDATGRRGRLCDPFLSDVVDEPADEVYMSRRYQLLSDAEPGPVNRGVISVAEADSYSLLVFPHDARTFTVCFTRLPEDQDLAGLRDVTAFEAAIQEVPLAAHWTDPMRAVAVSEVMVMAGLRSTFRTLSPEAPLGLHPLGDTVCTTNPRFGRGCSMAVAHALRLAAAVRRSPGDPSAWRDQVDFWVHGELRSWFDDGLLIDTQRAAVWRNLRSSRPSMQRPPAGAGPEGVSRLLVLIAAGADPEVARAVFRHMHMADPPTVLDTLKPLVGRLLGQGWRPGRPNPAANRTAASAGSAASDANGGTEPQISFAAPPRAALIAALTSAQAAGRSAVENQPERASA